MRAMQLSMELASSSSRSVSCCRPARASSFVLPRRSRGSIVLRAQAEQGTGVKEVDENILEFCSLDGKGGRATKKSLGEKEAEFLDALRSFYYDGSANMSNEEFDLLKEELIWEGSKVAVLSSDEKRFMEASMAYADGKPILSDAEFDDLKSRLKKANSDITVQGPRCSLRSKKMYSDATPDYLKMTLLNLPAAVGVLGVVFAIDFLTDFEVTKLIELPEPYGVIALWGLVMPTVLVLALSITQAVFKDSLILKAPCPSCGTENQSFFGEILTVAGNRGSNTVDCPNCKSKLVFNEDTRLVTVQGE